jgi:hypothetical protein
MPHDIPPGNVKAHGLILAMLNDPTKGTIAAEAVRGITSMPQGLVIRSVSQFEADRPPNSRKRGGKIAVFADSEQPLGAQAAHDELAWLVGQMKLLSDAAGDFFKPNSFEHY